MTNITAGDSVTWTIVQGVHTVTECDAGHVNCGNGFDSGILQNGDSFTHTFNTAGSVSYYCALHPDMTGVLNVQEPTPAPTAAPAGTTPPAGGTAAPTSTQSPGSVPQTGGPPMTESSTSLLWSLALVLGGLLVFGGGTAVVAARRR